MKKTSNIKNAEAKQNARRSGPWASISEAEAKMVQENVETIMDLAVWGKGSSDGCNAEEVTINQAISIFVDIASSAYTCLLLLNPTRALKTQQSGPLGQISQKEAKEIREQLQYALEIGTKGVQRVKRSKHLRFEEFFPVFSVLKEYGGELRGFLCPEDDDMDEESACQEK